ncbi:hypothetical protein PSHT_02070 [Puccinia striiformis]|uniref:Uncharacterized protein n=1 Tax=Puccinia striiformis TaxID=27350 RepID=A0A2S4WJ44_9BASI|nr:hypothetical protein PSHT_02070 [Puccinia striiformis]
MATPSISQAATGQPTNNTKNESDHPSKKRKATSDIWDHFIKKGTGDREMQGLMDAKTTNGITSLWRHLGPDVPTTSAANGKH